MEFYHWASHPRYLVDRLVYWLKVEAENPSTSHCCMLVLFEGMQGKDKQSGNGGGYQLQW